MELAQVMLTVPAERLGDVYAFAASLTREHATGAITGASEAAASHLEEMPDQSDPASPGDDLRWLCERAYLGGSGDFQRLLLDHLADNPGELLTIPEICEHIEDRDEQHFMRAMGAFSKRMDGRFPFRKGRKRGRIAYEMAPEAAEIIRELKGSA